MLLTGFLLKLLQDLNWLYQNDQGQQGHLEARIHVYDGRLWVDRGGGGMSDSPRPPDADSAGGASAAQYGDWQNDDSGGDDAVERAEEAEEAEAEAEAEEAAMEDEEEKEDVGGRPSSKRAKATQPPSYRDEDRQTATVSQLIVDKAQMYHSGRYICSTRATAGTWTLVHILAGQQLLSLHMLISC